MDKVEQVRKIQRWASHGTPRQFLAEVGGKVASEGYEAELDGNTVVFFKARKEGGFLGIGGRTVKQPVLKVIYGDNEVLVPEESVDEEFLKTLLPLLTQH